MLITGSLIRKPQKKTSEGITDCNNSYAIITIIISVTVVDKVINTLFVANIFMASLFFPALGSFFWWRTGEKAVWITTIVTIIAGFETLL